jgi:hydrophobe/amphiphile efflux-1 (HAE1) family protein
VSVLISAFSALSLSPALSSLLLRPSSQSKGLLARFFGGFNRGFEWTTNKYLAGVRTLIRRTMLAMAGLALFYFAAGGLFRALPGGFLPDEDQGVMFAAVRLPDGASLERNRKVVLEVEKIARSLPGIQNVTVYGGLDITTATNNSNVSTLILSLIPWEERKTKELQFPNILAQANRQFAQVDGAIVFGFGLPPILGLGTAGGFEFMLEDRAGGDIAQLADAAQSLTDAARKRPELVNTNSSFRVSVPQYRVDLDNDKAQALGIPVTDIFNSLQTFLGGLYVNDFNRFGRTWKVMMQAEPDFRDRPDDINRFYVRTSSGDMVPLSTLVTASRMSGPEVIYRYNRYRVAKVIGQNAPGYSSGEAASAMEQLAANLPNGFGYEWTGTVFQQRLSEGKEGFTFGFAGILVFLFLAALYESWSIPFAVVLAVPLGLFGALLAVWMRSFAYDVYTQIGIVTLIGLASKNAILIVEFAKLRREEGMPIFEAAIEAAKLRLRPILMTSFAFILGVLPLFFATGAGGAARRALGTAVLGGMLAATLLAVFIVPVLFTVMDGFSEGKAESKALEVPGGVPVSTGGHT